MTAIPEHDLIRTALAAYDLGTVKRATVHSGTAAKTWRVTTDKGEFLLRTRGSRSSSDRLIAYDHALRKHLLSNDIPTAVPRSTRTGQSFTRVDDLALEMYDIVPGHTLQHADPDQLRAAAHVLADFHRATRTFSAARELPPVAQYRTLGIEEPSRRMENPRLLRLVYTGLRQHAAASRYQEPLAVAFHWLDRIENHLGDTAYRTLPHTVTHGDFTLANILFVGTRVTGVFDFDWARWAPKVRDVADGMFFVAGERHTPLNPADIWSLTEAVELTASRCIPWLRSYAERGALSAAELQAVPLALAARWLSVRVEGMAKVPDERRCEFALANLAAPLDWLDTCWEDILGAIPG